MNNVKTVVAFVVATLICSCQAEPATKSPQTAAKPNRFAGMSANAFASVPLQAQEISALGISIGIPKNWVFTHHIEQKQKVWTVKSPCPDSVKFCANYVLNAVPRQKDLPLKNYGDFFITSLRDRYDTFTLISRNDEEINGVASTTIDYIHREQGLDLGGTVTFYFLDDTVVVVNFGALNEPKGDYVRYRGLYTRVLATIKPIKN